MYTASHKVQMLYIAGIFTSPNFLNPFRDRLAERLLESGVHVSSHSLFPYGDWTRHKMKQAVEIACDLVLPFVGGRRVRDGFVNGEPNQEVVLVGHSGGGVAAIQAGAALERMGHKVAAIVMIGSPKVPVPRGKRDRTMFVYACDRNGAVVDRITKLGSWRGRKPGRSVGIELIGSHADYFRASEPFVNEQGKSNLDMTADVVFPWLLRYISGGK